MRTPLPMTALTCDRAGISDRQAALLASSVLYDVGMISVEEKEKVIDRSKIRRERKQMRKKTR